MLPFCLQLNHVARHRPRFVVCGVEKQEFSKEVPERSAGGASLGAQLRETHESHRTAPEMWTEVRNESRTAISHGNSSKVRKTCFNDPSGAQKCTSTSPLIREKASPSGYAVVALYDTCLQTFRKQVFIQVVPELEAVSIPPLLQGSSVASTQMFWDPVGCLSVLISHVFSYLFACRCPKRSDFPHCLTSCRKLPTSAVGSVTCC